MQWQRTVSPEQNFLTIPEWEEQGVTAVFSTRIGGLSKPPYASLNLAFHVGDNPGDVLGNRKRFLSGFGYSLEDCVAAEQVHGTQVRFINEASKGLGMSTMETALPGCDGMLTCDNTALMCFFADCVPLYFFEPNSGIIGLAHAGWRGTVHHIAREMLTSIKKAGGDPDTCLVAIGPCIGPCCYTVGENVVSLLKEEINDRSSLPTVLTEYGQGTYTLDLAAANRILLTQEGIRPENITTAYLCTSCHSEDFFSYRREGITGRMAAFIAKK
ncbi:peptidoglycan editing factor PgeF [Dehalobacter sp. DCM]|uniref:peptidoglycan editing factor PgeF n=1 Tax=Dehalobacter sp. DCM TaxID=2907827 RepID=UPI003081E5FC|nr:peptidoglycan editing factor PgeF [Dehalobacter sp. DCM]